MFSINFYVGRPTCFKSQLLHAVCSNQFEKLWLGRIQKKTEYPYFLWPWNLTYTWCIQFSSYFFPAKKGRRLFSLFLVYPYPFYSTGHIKLLTLESDLPYVTHFWGLVSLMLLNQILHYWVRLKACLFLFDWPTFGWTELLSYWEISLLIG